MNMTTLKTGKIVPQPTLITTMTALDALYNCGSLAFFEFVELCRNSNHKIWSDEQCKELTDLSLIQKNGSVRSDVKEIVLAATIGDGLNLSLTSPIADNSC